MESTVLYKILSLKIDRLETDTGAGSKWEATTNAATGGNEISTLVSHDGKCYPTVKLKNCTEVKI